jgi:hypothetical protein
MITIICLCVNTGSVLERFLLVKKQADFFPKLIRCACFNLPQRRKVFHKTISPGCNMVVMKLRLLCNHPFGILCDEKRMILDCLTRLARKERILDTAGKTVLMSSDKTGIISIVFFRIIVLPCFFVLRLLCTEMPKKRTKIYSLLIM